VKEYRAVEVQLLSFLTFIPNAGKHAALRPVRSILAKQPMVRDKSEIGWSPELVLVLEKKLLAPFFQPVTYSQT